MKKLLSAILTVFLLVTLLSGCNKTNNGVTALNGNENTVGTVKTETNDDSAEADFSNTDDDMFTDRDTDASYNESESIPIMLDGKSATAGSDSVLISGGTVTVTEEATYIISGTLDDGMIIVNAPDTAKLQLVLDGADITSESSAALYILEADKVFVTLADGSENSLSNGGEFTAIDENNIDAALFSKQDLTLNGSGSLTVDSPAGHGITCKDDLVICGGAYTIVSASHAVDANDSVRISGDTDITADAGKDGIHAENTDDVSLGFVYISGGSAELEAEGDGIDASAYVIINNGTIDITAGGGSENGTVKSSEMWGGYMGGGMNRNMSVSTGSSDDSTSMKGIKAQSSLQISGGEITIDSADDAIHSDTSAAINGGKFEIATGDDGFHAEEKLTVSAGTINISECYEGLEALDISVTGGDITLVASDDGLNAAGGSDSSGTAGGRDGMFGGGGMSSSSNGSIVISGGTLKINSSGDGIDANGTLEISGGYTTVVGPTQGDTATLDYDTSGIISGGTFIGTGASTMAQSFSSSEQGVVAVTVGSQSAGTEVALKDSDGKVVLSFTPELSFQVVIFSSPDIVSGGSYTVTAGKTSGSVTAS